MDAPQCGPIQRDMNRMNEKAIEVRNLEFRYRNGDFSLLLPAFSVEESETVAVIGPSGTGKTTLLNLLAGCCSPDAGSVRVKGTDIVSMPDRARREFRIRSIGMIFQEFELLLSVLDNILLPCRITPCRTYDCSVRERAKDLAREMGVGDKLGRNVRQLSQGERQRVAVCRSHCSRNLRSCFAMSRPAHRDQGTDDAHPWSEREACPWRLRLHHLAGY